MTPDILTLIMYLVGVPNAILIVIGANRVQHLWRTRDTTRRETIDAITFARDEENLDRRSPGWRTGDCALWRVWWALFMERHAFRLQEVIEEALKTTSIATMDQYAEGWRTGNTTVRRVRRAVRAEHREQRQRTWMLEVTA